MVLVLKSAPAQQAALDALLAAQQTPASPLYHRWLSPAEFGARFGRGDAVLAQIVGWLAANGFTTEEIPAGRRMIVFSGAAGQVSDAFHTEIHRYRMQGTVHLANAQEPQIPASLSNFVEGILSLNDLRRTAQNHTRWLGAQPLYSAGATHYLAPADFAAIYDLHPLYDAGTGGNGVSIAIAARSNIRLDDVAKFRAMAGLPANAPQVVVTGSDPGLVTADQEESTIDAEWSGAVAPGASVKLVVAASSAATDGIDLASAWIVNHAVAPIVAVSYGSCEQHMGGAELAFYNSLWQQAAAQGMSVFVASGDAGAAGCSTGSDAQGTLASVNGLCSSPYSTCVGGTQFDEGANPAQYWAAANDSGYGSALGYIPEVVWNESGANGGTGMWASGGGISTVYAQPSWQTETEGGAAANGMRGVPDVALAAADHDGSIVVMNGSFAIVSGTSVTAPALSGIMALVVQKQGGAAQGNVNPQLYNLANAVSGAFHPTPAGNNSVPGVAGFTADNAAYNLATGLGSVDATVLAENWNRTSPISDGPNFSLVPSATSAMIVAGNTATFTIAMASDGAASQPASLSVVAPAGVTVRFSSTQILPGASALVQVSVPSTAATGNRSLSFMGANASGTQSFEYTLTVIPPLRWCPTRLVRVRCAPMILPIKLGP